LRALGARAVALASPTSVHVLHPDVQSLVEDLTAEVA
jgi:hypothetical protein